MHRVSSLRLPTRKKCHWILTVIIAGLLYGSVLSDNVCESFYLQPNNQSGTQQNLRPKLIVNVINSSLHQPYSVPDCNESCEVEVQVHEKEFCIILKNDTLEKQDIILVFANASIMSLLPSVLHNETTDNFFNLSLITDMKHINITKDDLHDCEENSAHNGWACQAQDPRKYIFFISCNQSKCCMSCKPLPISPAPPSTTSAPPSTTSAPSSTTSAPSSTTSAPLSTTSAPPPPTLDLDPLTSKNESIDAEKAADVMKNLSSLLEKMGNVSTAAVSMGKIKGLIHKLPTKNQTKIFFGISSQGVSMVERETDLNSVFSRSVYIPEEASAMAVKRNGSLVGVLVFPNMTKDEENSTVLNDEVVGIDMGASINNLLHTININYTGVNKSGVSVSCSSWNGKGKKPKWTTEGCLTVESNDSVSCQCTHLTFFAVLMSPQSPTTNLSSSDVKSLTYITNIGCGLSIFFLAVALFMHFVMRKGTSSQATKILMNLFIAMFCLNLTFLINETIANLGNFGACVTMAAAMHYALLATFSWFFIQALHLYLQLRSAPAAIKHYVIKICVSGWVTPAVVVAVILATEKYNLMVINTDGGTSVKMCWISDVIVSQGVNIGYYGVVFLFTFAAFVMVVHHISFMRKATAKSQDRGSLKTNTVSILGLFLLLGLTWAFAFFSYGPLVIPSYYIFTILNSFQGFFLFVYYYNTSKTADRGATVSSSSSATTSNTAITSPYAPQQ
ncbi:adhesion G-protein coupled receptor G5-like [Myripristis murdjan]|uniref:adhesion G-protein coupled receptor G5-like n=1 Tax=Myripristis murdjan TaxID=586833 RepID=UPI0011761F25|nr:adhesion G-protein coupled receptor G5-like [Myripristis murdjan]